MPATTDIREDIDSPLAGRRTLDFRSVTERKRIGIVYRCSIEGAKDNTPGRGRGHAPSEGTGEIELVSTAGISKGRISW